MANKNDTQMAISDFNMIRLNTKQLEAHIAATVEVGENIVIIGGRGSGKTMISKQAIDKLGFQESYVNMSVLERVDMAGYPNILAAAQKDKFVEFLPPKFLQPLMEGNTPVVALLDEVDKADPSLWAPLLEFTQFHSINGRHLPNLKAVIMTGNFISEGGQRPSLPLLDRAEKYILEPDQTSWLDWAGRSGEIHPSIAAYIQDHPQDLFGAPDPQDRYADPSPRGWHRASQILFKGEKKGWNFDLLNKKVAGCVGKDAGLKYSHYYEHYQQLLPIIENVFKGKDVAEQFAPLEPTKKLVACMIACARLSNFLNQHEEDMEKAKKSKEGKCLEYVGNFLNNADYEHVLVAVRSQIQVKRIIKWDLDEHPAWEGMINKINKQIGGDV